MHPESLKYLLQFGIAENDLFTELGRLLGNHFEFCLRQIANIEAKDLPKCVSLSEKVTTSKANEEIIISVDERVVEDPYNPPLPFPPNPPPDPG